MYNKLVFFLIFTLNLSISQAVDLEEALKNGYNNDEQLKIIRSDFLNEIEQFPRALAGFMPKVSAGINATDSKIKSKSNKQSMIATPTTNHPTMHAYRCRCNCKALRTVPRITHHSSLIKS